MSLRDALARALASIDVRARVRDQVLAFAPARPARVLAIGKAVGPMLDGALDALDALEGTSDARGKGITAALAVLPDGAPAPRADSRIRVLRAAHPLPDARSVAAGEAALAFGATLALVSGGASSLVFAPLEASGLADARAAIAALLASGADVRAINVVRRHASRVLGGGLGAVSTILASDVIGGAPHDIGSGPTAFDPTTVDDARRVLARFAPAHAALALRETPKPGAAPAPCAIVVEPADLAHALAEQLTRAGFTVHLLDASTADVTDLAGEYAALARSLGSGHAFVRSAEPSVTVTSAPSARVPGAGGRCTHLAALVGRDLPPGAVFLAAASDGVDGASRTAGAIVDARSFTDRAALDAAIASFDTGPLHLGAGTALPEAPSGLNLTDVHALART